MKKLFLTLALVAVVLVACKHVDAPAALTKVDSTAVVVDTVQADSTSVDTVTVDTTATK